MSFFELVVLALIQGVAEFLPISSSGHLVLMGHWFGIEEDKGTINIVLHFGTLLSIIVFYHAQIRQLVFENRRVIPLLIAGTIPGVLLGLLIDTQFEWLTVSPWLAASMLVVTGIMLIASKYVTREDTVDYRQTTWLTAIGIGLAQAIAILPGISRSGSTIFAGQLLGLKRESAATFSFLLALPIIAGATAYQIVKLIFSSEGAQTQAAGHFLVVGALISFVTGYISLCVLIRFVQKGKFYLFAWWCIPVGIISLLYLAFQS